jgi:HEAT repeat protein
LNSWSLSAISASLAALTLCAGCESSNSPSVTLDSAFKKLFEPRRTPQQHMILAVSDSDPDIRRESVTRLATSKESDRDWAVKGYVAIATLESDPQARCVAIRALAKTRDGRAVETCLKILNHEEYPAKEIRPPDELTRWDATLALGDLSDGAVPEEQKTPVRDSLLSRLANDSNRNVRAAAARGLAFYKSDESLSGLIEGLRDEHFAVVHECENSLTLLTGETHNCSPTEWKAWHEANSAQPFAKSGALPDSRKKPYDSTMGKVAHDTKQIVQWMFPGSK